jgi:hypothetical protein
MGFETFKSVMENGKEKGATRFAPRSPRLRNIGWKDGEKRFVRFLTDYDEMIAGKFAEFVVTNDGRSTMDFLIDPEGTNWVEEFGGQSKSFSGEIGEPRYRNLLVAVAVLRKEVSIGGGRTEFVDDERTEEVDGKELKALTFVIVKQSRRNFWEHLEGMAARNQTIVDRDFEIVRAGSDKTTYYKFAPLDPIEGLRDKASVHDKYGYGRQFDPQSPDRYMYCPETLGEWIARYSGEERARHFLLPPDPKSNGLDEFAQETSSNPVELDEAQTAESFEDLRAKLQAHVKK